MTTLSTCDGIEASLAFTLDGSPTVARPGDTVAAAMVRAGAGTFGHRRDGTARGLWCGMGACSECVVTIDGRPGQRACVAPVRTGMRVERTPPADTAPVHPPESLDEVDTDVAVVGAGPAGLVAARWLAAAGLRVLVLDERAEAGGQHAKPVHAWPDVQSAAGERLRAAAWAAGVEHWPGCTVWSAFGPGELGVLRDGRAVVVRPRALLLAPGAYERPVPIPGWTLPGVMTAGAAQILARSHGVRPGRRAVVAGNGPLNLLLAGQLHRAGVAVAAVAEAAPAPGPRAWGRALQAAEASPGLMAAGLRSMATLRAAGIPVRWGSAVVAASGADRVEACTIRTPTGTETIDCDVLALGGGLIPSTELARQLGCRHVFVDRHVGFLATDTDADGATDVPGVWAIGDGAAPGGAVAAGHRAVLAAASIGRALGAAAVPDAARVRAGRRARRADRFQAALWRLFAAPAFEVDAVADAAVVCRCEGVTAGRLRSALAQHGADAGTAKRMTRVGMGACQGRNCAAVLARLVASAGGAPAGAGSFLAPRAPARPVPLGLIALEKPEWGGHRRSVPPAAAPRPDRTRPRWDGVRETDVLVVGAGVVGACVARALAQDGIDVLVVDRDAPGQQASTANAGSLHVQLLSFDFGAKAEAGGGPAAETLRLGPGAIALWREIAAAAPGAFDMSVTGGMMLADTPAQLAFLRRKAALEARHGVDTAVIGGNELRTMEPHVSPDAIGAAYCAAEGKIDPLRATFAVLAQARAAGAMIEADAPVLSVTPGPDGFRVETGGGTVRARRIVNCAGAWSPRLSAMVAGPIPVAGAPLQMMVTQPGPFLTGRLLAHADRHLSLKQTATGQLLVGGGWSAGLDERTGASTALRWAMEGNAHAACRVLPAAAAFPLLRVWAGMNINIDGAPILGGMPGVPGFWNCVTSNGYTLAPMVAAMTVEAMRAGTDRGLAPFTLDRF